MSVRVGILQCDEVCEELRTEFGDYPKMISEELKKVRPKWSTTTFHVFLGEFPNELNDCDAYITTGSRSSVYDDEQWIGEFEKLVRVIAEKRVPFVGVCFGHQMMAQALGGVVKPADSGWGVGVSTIRFSDRDIGSLPLPEELSLIVSHQDQVTGVPPGLEILGGNDFCPVSWCRYGETMLGIQGHPEFSKAYSRALMDLRRELIGEKAYAAGIASLDQPVDAESAFECIAQFLEQAI